MRQLIFILAILFTGELLANPLTMPPVISEFYYNDGDWQLEIYFESEVHGATGLSGLNSFDFLCLECTAGIALFNPGIPLVWDSIYVIDQSWLISPFSVNPFDDQINVLGYENGNTCWIGESIYYSINSSTHPAPGNNESIAVQYIYTQGTDWPDFQQMKQSPPTMGTHPYSVDTRCSYSGYVFDQFQNPLEGVEFIYCDPSYCNGYSTPVFYCFQTDENGYFQCDSLFPMFHMFDLTYAGFVYEEDNFFMDPVQPTYKEYTFTSVGISRESKYRDISIISAPNPFSQKTTFHISMPDYQRWEKGEITIRNMNGQLVDVISFPNAVWSGNVFTIDWYPGMARGDVMPGLYLYSLEVDGRSVSSNKLIINN
ncbi:MAG: T9SS type A sorting domain-containing protein [Bacteroidota bacterium]